MNGHCIYWGVVRRFPEKLTKWETIYTEEGVDYNCRECQRFGYSGEDCVLEEMLCSIVNEAGDSEGTCQLYVGREYDGSDGPEAEEPEQETEVEKPIEKAFQYLKLGETAPNGVPVKTGKRGGRYYDPKLVPAEVKQSKEYKDWAAKRKKEHEEKYNKAEATAKIFIQLNKSIDNIPKIRNKCLSDLKTEGMSIPKMSAIVTILQEKCGFRIGAKSNIKNGVFGISTLQVQHLTIKGNELTFNYIGKGSKQQQKQLVHPDIAREMKSLIKNKKTNDPIFSFVESGKTKTLSSQNVNDYIRDYDLHSHNWRHLMGTKIYIESVIKDQCGCSKSAMSNAVKKVAESLGNTPRTSKMHYINPEFINNCEKICKGGYKK